MNNISWVDNKVFNATSQKKYPAASAPDSPAAITYAPPSPLTDALEGQLDNNNIFMFEEGPPTVRDRSYIPGYLESNIGKTIRAEFLVGTSQYIDKAGKLVEVGANYFVLEDLFTNDLIMCDLYSVKFVTIF